MKDLKKIWENKDAFLELDKKLKDLTPLDLHICLENKIKYFYDREKVVDRILSRNMSYIMQTKEITTEILEDILNYDPINIEQLYRYDAELTDCYKKVVATDGTEKVFNFIDAKDIILFQAFIKNKKFFILNKLDECRFDKEKVSIYEGDLFHTVDDSKRQRIILAVKENKFEHAPSGYMEVFKTDDGFLKNEKGNRYLLHEKIYATAKYNNYVIRMGQFKYLGNIYNYKEKEGE